MIIFSESKIENGGGCLLARVLAVLFLYVGSGVAAVSCSSDINPVGTFSTTVASSNLNGCLKIGGGGLLANSSSSPWTDFFVAWSIQSLGRTDWQYSYTFSDPTSEGKISNIAYVFLGVSPPVEPRVRLNSKQPFASVMSPGQLLIRRKPFPIPNWMHPRRGLAPGRRPTQA